MNNDTISKLDQEFTQMLINSSKFRDDQRNYVSYYNNNVFYAPSAGEPTPKRNVGVNLLKTFADKNIHYSSTFPKMKKIANSADIQARMQASLMEKIILGVWGANDGKLKQRKWATDGTLMAEAHALIEWDFDDNMPLIKRLDPRYTHVLFANNVDSVAKAVYYAVPMTKEAIKAKFGVDATTTQIAPATTTLDGNQVPVDGVERFYVIKKYTDDTVTSWVGEHIIEPEHKHGFDSIPVVVCKPFESGQTDGRGGFYLSDLTPLQAEFNETLRRRSNIIRKLSNPAVWGRGIMAAQFDEVKKALEGAGGFVGLKANGELAFLQLQQTDVLDKHLEHIEAEMKNISGMGDAAFGRAGGANTSAAAVAMYFQPTVKHVLNQWIAWSSFYESINDLIFQSYKFYGKTGQEFTVYGERQGGAYEYLESANDETGEQEYNGGIKSGGFAITFTKDDLSDDHCTEIVVPDITPKDTTATQQLVINAVQSGFMSRVTAYDLFGLTDPEDELNLLQAEREDPRLHPEVLQQVSQATATMAGAQQQPDMMANAGAPQLPAETATSPLVTPPAR